MPHIEYVEKKFSNAHREIINNANYIIREYQSQGFSLTLRQLYYQFVARDMIANKTTEYKRLGTIINHARLAGLIDWNAIEDRTRNLVGRGHWNNPRSVVESAVNSYHKDMWEDQTYRPEVWIEKEALVGVIDRVCTEMDVPYFACRGYTSQSEVWRAGQRFKDYMDDGQIPVVIHLGDHDPSGIDMTRDNADRLWMFAESKVQVVRVALNMDQVDLYNPPPNPAKMTDSRFAGYANEFGYESWELDALNPNTINSMIEDALNDMIDSTKWIMKEAEIESERKQIKRVCDNWHEVQEYLTNK
jgi:hypothetical protein